MPVTKTRKSRGTMPTKPKRKTMTKPKTQIKSRVQPMPRPKPKPTTAIPNIYKDGGVVQKKRVRTRVSEDGRGTPIAPRRRKRRDVLAPKKKK